MINTRFPHNALQPVIYAIRPLGVSRRLVSTLVKASSAAAVGSSSVLHQQAAAAASLTVTPNLVQLVAIAESLLASTAITHGKLLCNPASSWQTSQEYGCRILIYRLKQMIAQLANGCDEDLIISNPRYMGIIPELVALAEKNGCELDTEEVHTYLEEHPEILTDAGFSKGDKYHVDHIWPTCKGGRDHPCNYCLMPPIDNYSFGGRITMEKCWEVGLAAVIQVLLLHLPGDLELGAMLMG